ncbi:MAG TPA: phage holin family protein [Dongiaceae bacterium]|nr:phage holin family protein [Dongiaceae bacterium]
MAYGNIRSFPEIFTDLFGQVTNLVRKEGQLARAEISEKATRALTGMAMIVLGAVLLIPALTVLLQAGILGLVQNGADPTIAALLIGGGAFLIGMVLGLIGWSWVKPTSLVPDKTIDQLKRDAQVPRHTGITSHYGETGGATSERVVREEAGYGDRNRAA